MRGSDPDAAVYWLERMLAAGEDPLFILRRMLIFASEDIGNADPQALQVAVAALHAFQAVGMPEGVLNLIQAATYLATAPKSNAVLKAHHLVQRDIKSYGSLPVPLHLRNAPTRLMKKLGYGEGYKYPHNYPGGYVKQDYLPEKLKTRRYYLPSDRGKEAEIKKRLEKIKGGFK
jgi:putative ATPase